jgi:hypothetical protein
MNLALPTYNLVKKTKKVDFLKKNKNSNVQKNSKT